MFQCTRHKSLNRRVGVPERSITGSSAFTEFRFADLPAPSLGDWNNGKFEANRPRPAPGVTPRVRFDWHQFLAHRLWRGTIEGGSES